MNPSSCAYLTMHDDINSDPIGFDESSSGGGSIYLVILGKSKVK